MLPKKEPLKIPLIKVSNFIVTCCTLVLQITCRAIFLPPAVCFHSSHTGNNQTEPPFSWTALSDFIALTVNDICTGSAAGFRAQELPVESEWSEFRASDAISVLESVWESALPLIDLFLVKSSRRGVRAFALFSQSAEQQRQSSFCLFLPCLTHSL